MANKKEKNRSAEIIPQERIENRILLIRSKKVMLDSDLAELYKVATGQLKRAVNRNINRFPEDFMFELTKEEAQALRCQFGISKKGRGGQRYLQYVFTQEGVAMLSSVLNSERAIGVNIQIMRAFVRLRELMISHKDLARKLDDLELKFKEHDKSILLIFRAIKELLQKPKEPEKPKLGIGFHVR